MNKDYNRTITTDELNDKFLEKEFKEKSKK